MSQCYKCGRELPGSQIECEPVCAGEGWQESDDEEASQAEEFRKNFMEVDWEKVTTLGELIEILKVGQSGLIYVAKDDPNFERVRKFLKPIES